MLLFREGLSSRLLLLHWFWFIYRPCCVFSKLFDSSRRLYLWKLVCISAGYSPDVGECPSITLSLDSTVVNFELTTKISAVTNPADDLSTTVKTTVTVGSSAGGSTAFMPAAINGSQTLTMKTVSNAKNKITLKNNHQMQCLSILDSNDCLKTPTVPDMLKTPTINTSTSKATTNFVSHADDLNTPSICLSTLAPKNHPQAFFGDHEPLLNGKYNSKSD